MGLQESPLSTRPIPRRTVIISGSFAALGLLAACAQSESPAEKRQRLEDEAIKNRLNQSVIEMLTQKGVWGDHSLVDLRDIAVFNLEGEVKGGIMFVNGTVEGRTVQKLQFGWTTNSSEDPATVISSLETSRVLLKDPKRGVKDPQPTITFDFALDKFIAMNNGGIYTARIVDLGDNPNDYINEDLVKKATIRMTQSQFAQFTPFRQ